MKKILDLNNDKDTQAGTGTMLSLSDSISYLQKKGYTENLVPAFDHLTVRSGEIKLYPRDFFIDEIIRFEVASDPDDNSIMYAITCEKENIKGLYVESYGTYHDELSQAMIERIKFCREQRRKPRHYVGKPHAYEQRGSGQLSEA